MNNIDLLHESAMEACDLAFQARANGDAALWTAMIRQAFERERDAARLTAFEPAMEPTRSILHRSAAALAMDCGEVREAERLIASALAGDPPGRIAEELRDLLEEVNFSRHLSLRGLKLASDEVQLAIDGSATSFGMAQSDLFFNKVRAAELLFIRAAERMIGNPFREARHVPDKIARNFEVYLSVPRAASFAVTLKIGVPEKQLNLPSFEIELLSQPDLIVDDVMSCLELFAQGDLEGLRAQIPDGAYYRNFTALAERLAPDGDRIKTVGLTALRGDHERRVALRPEVRSDRRQQAEARPGHLTVVGTLKYADSRKASRSNVLVIDDEGTGHKFFVEEALMADIVHELFEQRVVADGILREKRNWLERMVPAVQHAEHAHL